MSFFYRERAVCHLQASYAPLHLSFLALDLAVMHGEKMECNLSGVTLKQLLFAARNEDI